MFRFLERSSAIDVYDREGRPHQCDAEECLRLILNTLNNELQELNLSELTPIFQGVQRLCEALHASDGSNLPLPPKCVPFTILPLTLESESSLRNWPGRWKNTYASTLISTIE